MALPLTQPVSRRILTASAAKMNPGKRDEAKAQAAAWQDGSFSWVKVIPELNYASRFYSKMLKSLRIYPALRDTQDRTEVIETGPPVEILDRIQDPGGGRSQILRSYGRLMFIAGEGYLFGRGLETDDERWAFVSTKEVKLTDGKIIWTPTSGSSPKEYTSRSAVLYRFWFPDPEFSGEPESPMRAALEIAQELAVLTKAVKTTAVSRMLTGILKVPAELSFGSDEEGMEEDAESNPFLRDIIEWATGIIEMAGSAEAAAPFIAEGASEFLANLEFMETHKSETDYMEKDLRAEAINRLAMGLDMPAELLKGLAEANHWGARQIMHSAWTSHGRDIAEQFCDDLADSYLRPALRDAGYEDWRRVVVSYDDSAVVVSPDRSDDAHKIFNNGGMSWEGYRKSTATPEEYAPSEEEFKIFLAIRMREPGFLKGTKYEIDEPVIRGEPGPQPDPGRNGTGDAEEGPANPGPSGTTRRESRGLAMRGAAEMALLRCREVAGARIRTHHRKTSDFAALFESECRNTNLAAIAGQTMLSRLKTPEPMELVKGGADGFVAICREWGIEDAQAVAMGQMIEVYASRTLFEEGMPQFPSGLAAAIERANDVTTEMIVRRNNEALAELAKKVPGVGALASS